MNLLEMRDKLVSYMSVKHYSDETIKVYASHVIAFGVFLTRNKEVSKLRHSERVEKYLTWRVREYDISPSTQNVELNALVLFHRVLGIELNGINALRARKRDRIPPILSKDQVAILIREFPHEFKLVPMILYGCGMRINECLRLRIKDVDLSLEKLTIHEAKGDKERIVKIPPGLLPLVRVQYDKAVSRWNIDQYHSFNGVNCGGIEKKYPSYPMSKEWYWLFPAVNYSTNPKTHTPMMRHHVMEYTIQRVFKDTSIRYCLPVYATPHSLRHACLTHMAQDMLEKGFPEKMIKAQLKEISGHVMDETLENYLHLAAPKNAFVISPIEELVQTNYTNGVV